MRLESMRGDIRAPIEDVMHEIKHGNFANALDDIQDAVYGSRSFTSIVHSEYAHPCFGNRVAYGVLGTLKPSSISKAKERDGKGKKKASIEDDDIDEAMKFFGLECFSSCPGSDSVVEGSRSTLETEADLFGPLPESPPLAAMDISDDRGTSSSPSPDPNPLHQREEHRGEASTNTDPPVAASSRNTVHAKRKVRVRDSHKRNKRQRVKSNDADTPKLHRSRELGVIQIQ